MRDDVIRKGVKIGRLPATGEPYYLFAGTVWLVTYRSAVNCGPEREFRDKAAEGKVRFAA